MFAIYYMHNGRSFHTSYKANRGMSLQAIDDVIQHDLETLKEERGARLWRVDMARSRMDYDGDLYLEVEFTK